MEKKPFLDHMKLLVKNGVQLSEKLTWTQIIEPNLMLIRNCLLLNVNLIILYKKDIEAALLHQVSKLMHNCSTKHHGKQKQIPTPISLELSIEIGIIKLNHSISQH